VPGGAKPTRLSIDSSQFHVHEAHGPIAAFRFRESDRFMPDGLTNEDQLPAPFDLPGVPDAADSLVLIVEDADAPTPNPLVHAIVVGLSPDEPALIEGAIGSADHAGGALITGRNSYLQSGWLPPDPPPGHGVHRYAFQVFALGAGAAFSGTVGREAVHEALQAHAIASGCLIGTYERPDGSVTERAASPARVGTLA